MPNSVNYKRIQRIDFFRNFFLSATIPIIEVVFMLIFIKSFNASLVEKTVLTIFIKSSFLIGIPICFYIFKYRYNINVSLAIISFFSAISLFLFNRIQQEWLFLLLVLVVALPVHGVHSLIAEFYNFYPQRSRGKRFVTSNIALFGGSIIFSLIYNQFFEVKPITMATYNFLIIIAACSLLVSASFSYLLPMIKFSGLKSPSYRGWFKILKEDKMFSYVCLAWGLLGIANLWLLSYRTNLLVEERFGFSYDEKTVFLLLIFIPQFAYLLFHIPFAYFFDRYNVIILRIVINICIALNIYFFFISGSFYGHFLGAFFYGVATSGGNLAWKLWIHKIVPNNKVSTYMNIHIFFTGLRMFFAPIFGLWGLYEIGPFYCGLISLFLLGISTVMFLFLIDKAKKKYIY